MSEYLDECIAFNQGAIAALREQEFVPPSEAFRRTAYTAGYRHGRAQREALSSAGSQPANTNDTVCQ